MNVLEIGVSKLGRWSKRISALSMLLRLDELPGKGWNLVFEQAWRVGESPGLPFETKAEFEKRRAEESDRAARAREAGGFIGYRIASLANPFREVIAEVMPNASPEDAVAAVPEIRESSRSKPSSQIKVIEEREIEEEFTDDSSMIFIERDQLHKGVPCNLRMVIGAVDDIAYSVGCSAHGEAWSWGEVKDIASHQADKIRSARRRNSGRNSLE